MIMAALLVMSCVLVIFGFAETGVLLPFHIRAAPGWLGVIIPLTVIFSFRRIPAEGRLSWVLIACGFVAGTAGHRFGATTTSTLGWFGFGVVAFVSTVFRTPPRVAARRSLGYIALWVVLAVLLIAAILFLPPL